MTDLRYYTPILRSVRTKLAVRAIIREIIRMQWFRNHLWGKKQCIKYVNYECYLVCACAFQYKHRVENRSLAGIKEMITN